MLRQHLMKKGAGVKTNFRMRGNEITRIEGFSDAVFAFAITLLVVSLEVPKTFSELMETMRGFIAFACGFALLFMIWYNQYSFFRRYGLQDTATIVLTGILLFVVLFFVYPLKFLFSFLIKAWMGYGITVQLPDGTVERAITAGQFVPLMLIYSCGYIAIFGLFALLYLHAYRKRGELELNELELFDTRYAIREQLLNVAIGLLSALIVLIGGEQYAGWSGLAYMLIGPVLTLNGSMTGKKRKIIERRFSSAHTGDS